MAEETILRSTAAHGTFACSGQRGTAVELTLQIIGVIGLMLAAILVAAGRCFSGLGQFFIGRAEYEKARRSDDLIQPRKRKSKLGYSTCKPDEYGRETTP